MAVSYYTRKLIIGIAGILTSTVTISYLIEKVFTQKYEVEGSKKTQFFVYPTLVTWMGCLFCSLYGLFYAYFFDKKPNQITIYERFRLGLLFTLNYLPTNYALLYISYPLQVIAKNMRYLLVVIVAVFFSRVKKNKYLKLPKSKIFIAIMITLGAGSFMYFDADNKSGKEGTFHPQKKWVGFFLLFLAICCDALFSDSQAYCKSTFQPSQNQLFLAANLYGFALIFTFAIISGELAPSLRFLMRHPSIQLDLLLIASLQVISQVSVYYVISNFKQHIYPLISTVRKVLTILFSIWIFQHKLNIYQWTSLVVVFVDMAYELYDEIKSQEEHRRIRKDRLKAQYEQSNSEYPSSVLNEVSNIKSSNQGKSRPNSFLNSPQISKAKEESLSKYGYKWRRNEVAENRETSLSPFVDKDKRQ